MWRYCKKNFRNLETRGISSQPIFSCNMPFQSCKSEKRWKKIQLLVFFLIIFQSCKPLSSSCLRQITVRSLQCRRLQKRRKEIDFLMHYDDLQQFRSGRSRYRQFYVVWLWNFHNARGSFYKLTEKVESSKVSNLYFWI